MKPDRFMWECCGIRFANSAAMRGTVEGPLAERREFSGSPKTAAPPSRASWSYGFSEAALPHGPALHVLAIDSRLGFRRGVAEKRSFIRNTGCCEGLKA